MQPNSALLLQSSLMQKPPDSLNNLYIRSINAYIQNTEESSTQISTVHYLSKISKKDQANMRFIDTIPECLKQTKKKTKILETDNSEYETMDEFIRHYQQEEQENAEPSITYEISDNEYFTENSNKFKTDSWILAKFVTKKSVKHFVGKVMSMKDDVPEVKFVKKVKESKFKRGSVFTYPTIEDICTMKHLDDIVKVLPEPKISRRGHIIFNTDLSNYNIQ
ncbi:hypothetical protein ACJJTC_015735 [Scirpophaga incertulas]